MKKALGILLASLLVATTACGAQEHEVQTGNPDSGQGTAQSNSSSGNESLSTEPTEPPVPPAEPVSEFYDKMVTIPKEYKIEDYSNGYFIATKSDGRLYGLLDPEGKTVIDFTYDELRFDFDGAKARPFVYAEYDGKYGVVDLNGKVLIKPAYKSLSIFSENDMFFAKKEYSDSQVYYLSKEGELISSIDPLENLTSYKDAYASSHEDDSILCVALDQADQVYVVLIDLQGKEIAKVKIPDNIEVDIEHHLMSASKLELEQGSFIEVSIHSGTIGNAADSKKTIVLDYSGNVYPELSVTMFSSQILEGLDHIVYAAVADNGVLVPKFVNTKTRNILPGSSDFEYMSFGTFKDKQAFAVTRNHNDGLFYLTIINDKAEIIKEITSLDRRFGGEIPIIIKDKAFYFSNDTWKMISLDKLEPNQERYYGIQKLKEGKHWWLLENADGENALVSSNGEIVVDFGNITKDSFLEEPVLEYIISDEACCFIIEGETENEAYIVNS